MYSGDADVHRSLCRFNGRRNQGFANPDSLKTVKKELGSIVHPRSIKRIRFDDHPVEHEVLRAINVFLIVYLVIYSFSMLIISVDGFSFETNFTAVAATLNNIGPGLDQVGPTSNFFGYGPVSKLILIFDMLAGTSGTVSDADSFLSVYLEEERIKRFTGKKRDFASAGNCREQKEKKKWLRFTGFSKKTERRNKVRVHFLTTGRKEGTYE